MTIAKLLSHAAPINKDAAIIIRPAKMEDTWMPKVNVPENIAFSKNILRTKPIPKNAFLTAGFSNPTNKRRGKLVVVGYAENQPKSKNSQARWVVRCDCGNYEHRSRIMRWLGTDATDMCLECRTRTYKTLGEFSSREPAKRATVEKHRVSPSYDCKPTE